MQKLWAKLFVPKKVVAIMYVRFQLLFDNEHVDVLQSKTPDFPTQSAEYTPIDVQYHNGQKSRAMSKAA